MRYPPTISLEQLCRGGVLPVKWEIANDTDIVGEATIAYEPHLGTANES